MGKHGNAHWVLYWIRSSCRTAEVTGAGSRENNIWLLRWFANCYALVRKVSPQGDHVPLLNITSIRTPVLKEGVFLD